LQNETTIKNKENFIVLKKVSTRLTAVRFPKIAQSVTKSCRY